MKKIEAKYRCLPFWSWNDELEPNELIKQIDWMHENGVGGFFMHARGGLRTPYLGDKWFECVEASGEEAKRLGMEAYAYDENGWPSGFAGGKLLENPANHDHYLTFSYGPYDETSLVSYDYKDDKLIRVTSGEDVLNVYDHISASTADILNKEVVDQFINLTHEEYKKRDKYGLKGFFTDEPQYYRWGEAYTRVMPQYFLNKYGTDILDQIGLLFVEKEGYKEFRYRYWKGMQELMLSAFSKNIYDWCDKNGYKLTGHYVEETCLFTQMWCCAGIMPMYEYEHIPGVDWLGRPCPDFISGKQVGSVASQLGKKQVLTEIFACMGWDVTPIELKQDAEALYASGVNLMCQHLMPYSEHGQRKRDYPAHYSPINPWIKKGFKDFNDYFAALGKLLAESDEIVDVAVLHPIRSAYFDFKRYLPDEEMCGLSALEGPFHEVAEKLTAAHVSWHFVDETILAKHGYVKDGKLHCGEKSYSILVFPLTYTMDESTEKLLHQFMLEGGKVSLPYGKPTYLEGKPYDYPYLKENISFDDVLKSMPFYSSVNPNIRLSFRQNQDGQFLYLANTGEETDINFVYEPYTSFEQIDPLTDESKIVPLNLHFLKGESKILRFSKKIAKSLPKRHEIHLGNTFKVTSPVTNYLTLDNVAYSFDGQEYRGPFNHMGVFFELLEKRYEGDLYLKYTFLTKNVPSHAVLEIEDSHLISAFLNGKELTSSSHVPYEPALKEFDASSALKEGENEVIVKMHYFQGENVYYALFGENVTESLKNCLAYDSDIEPIYIRGDFGVYGEFHDMGDNVVAGHNFYIDGQQTEIKHLIEDGFPFFKGNITLEQDIEVDDLDSVLVIEERFQLLEIECNGHKVPSSWYEYRFDLAPFLKKGTNHLKLVLTVSPRNLMGPHHSKIGEDLSVGPHTFERQGTWKDGKSSELTDDYNFVRTIL